ncbi:MAG: S-layer homology domain-containing protein, partial [Firmicutes bacterium]|nr:S-layer homology domain-containing protein [Bacillota bacterium]
KKLMSAIVASVIAVSSLVPVFATDTFKDVNSKSYSWAYSYVEDMAERGLIKGYEDGTFRPGNSVSRMEAFALFARLMGSNSEVNADTVQEAKQEYADILSKYNLSYAEGDVAFMLLRGVITEDELDTYFEGSKKTEAMPRYEAAILITKAMLGEQDAKNEVLVDMDYTDVSSIPKSAKQYVYYVTQKGIMSGMGNNEFSANTDVLRGQIAVMLSKTADSADYAFDSVTISGLDENLKNIKIKDADGKEFTIGYTDSARFFKDGEAVASSSLKSGQKAVLTYVSDGDGTRLAFADVFAGSVDERKSVIFKSYTSKGGTLMLTVIEPENEAVGTYILDDSASITADGAAININKLKSGDYITIGLAGDFVVEIDAMQKNAKVNAVIEKIGTLGTITISSDEPEFDGLTLSVAQNVAVYKNGDTAGFSDLGRGDKVVITLEYGIITKINATSAKKTVTGVFKGYSILDTTTITINRDGEDYTFDIPANVEIILNGEKAALSDIKRGSSITVTVESEVVKKITASNSLGNLSGSQVTGTVAGVYDKTISIVNSENGGDVAITVYCTASTRIYAVPKLNDYAVKNIKNGDTLVAYGEYSNGIFVASGIIITPSAQ